MKDAARTGLHHHEDGKTLKASGNRDHEVARRQGPGVVADKCVPSLRAAIGPDTFTGPVGSRGPRRDPDTKFQPKLTGNPLFSPGRIPTNHLHNQLPDVQRNGTSARSRLPLPKQSERLAMPADQGCGLDNRNSGSPVNEARPEDQPEPSRVRQPLRPNLALPIERQLFAKKQILGNQSSARTENQTNEIRSVALPISKNVKYRPNQPERPHRSDCQWNAPAFNNRRADRTGRLGFAGPTRFLRSTGKGLP